MCAWTWASHKVNCCQTKIGSTDVVVVFLNLCNASVLLRCKFCESLRCKRSTMMHVFCISAIQACYYEVHCLNLRRKRDITMYTLRISAMQVWYYDVHFVNLCNASVSLGCTLSESAMQAWYYDVHFVNLCGASMLLRRTLSVSLQYKRAIMMYIFFMSAMQACYYNVPL